MNNDAFDHLKMDFPIFELRNLRPYATPISLIGGDSVQAQPFATIKVESNKLYQLPDLSAFRLVSPSMEDCINYGLIGGKNNEQTEAKTAENSESKLAEPNKPEEVKPEDEVKPDSQEPVTPTVVPNSSSAPSTPNIKSTKNR